MQPLQDIVVIDGHMQTMYMAVYADKLLLLDGGCLCDVDLIIQIIRGMGRPISQLKTVVVTHMHPDHAGGAIELKKRTGCTIASAVKPKQWYGGVAGRLMYGVDVGLAYWVSNRQNKPFKNLLFPRTLHPDVALSEGDAVPHFADWQILETAGHTDRDLSVYHADTKQIYTADLLIKLRHKYVSPFPIYLPDTYRASLKKVRDLQPKQVMMAHGGKQAVAGEVFDDLIARSPKYPLNAYETIKHKLTWRFRWKQKVADAI